MGPCPSGQSSLVCGFTDSFNTWMWLDPQLTMPPLGADPDSITISGFSGGGTMATIMHTIYSDTIKGAGLIASGPYGDKHWKSDHYGTDISKIALAAKSVEKAVFNKNEGLIDSTSSFNGSPVFIMSGQDDVQYPPVYQQAQQEYYNNFDANVEYVSLPGVGHEIPSAFASNQLLNPSNSNYDLSGNMLKHIMTNLPTNAIPESSWGAGDTDWWQKGVLKKFYQDEFLDTLVWQVDGLARYGYIYYPDQCYNGSTQCKVHMHLHGCYNTVDGLFYGYQSLSDGGWMEYSVANDIILILPQAKFDLISNSGECFDFSNYALWWNENRFLTNKGVQPAALKRMLERATQPLDDKYNYPARNILKYSDFEFFLFDSWRFIQASPEWFVNVFYMSVVYFIPAFFLSIFGIQFDGTF